MGTKVDWTREVESQVAKSVQGIALSGDEEQNGTSSQSPADPSASATPSGGAPRMTYGRGRPLGRYTKTWNPAAPGDGGGLPQPELPSPPPAVAEGPGPGIGSMPAPLAGPPSSAGVSASVQSRLRGGEDPDTSTSSDDDKGNTAEERSLLNKVIRNKLINTTCDIEVLRQDPKNPLYSARSFEELNLKPQLLRGVYMMGFSSPSKIQERALPLLLSNPPRNLIAQSQSGTGKTAAFVLAMLSRVKPDLNYPQVLCLSPTYELAKQTGEVCQKMGQYMSDVRVCYALRGENVARGQPVTDHIIIGTPGTVIDWAMKFKVFDLRRLSVFVLDEADVMIATQGHQDQSIRIHRQVGSGCQVMFFSATYDDAVMQFAEQVVPDATIFRLRRHEESLDNIKQFYVECRDRQDKFRALCQIYGSISIGQSMIFCHTRKSVQWLKDRMTEEGHAVAMLSGELSIEERVDVLQRFRDGLDKVLITTNVAARGIDVEQVTVVVNYDLPLDVQTMNADCETYLHRIGRTGRFGKAGVAINFVDMKSAHLLRQIEQHFGRKIDRIDTSDADELEKLAD